MHSPNIPKLHYHALDNDIAALVKLSKGNSMPNQPTCMSQPSLILV